MKAKVKIKFSLFFFIGRLIEAKGNKIKIKNNSKNRNKIKK